MKIFIKKKNFLKDCLLCTCIPKISTLPRNSKTNLHFQMKPGTHVSRKIHMSIPSNITLTLIIKERYRSEILRNPTLNSILLFER